MTIDPCLVSWHQEKQPSAFSSCLVWRWKYVLVISNSFVKHKVKNPNLSHHGGGVRQLRASHNISPLTLAEIPPSDLESLEEEGLASPSACTYPGQPGEGPGQRREEQP